MKNYDMLNKHKLTLMSSSLLAVAALFFSGCWKSEIKDKESKLVVINVLDKDYYDDCHIAGSVNIPFGEVEDRITSLNKKDQHVIYCSNYACTAAPFTAGIMKKAGFENVSVFHGGIVQWHQKGYPCTGPATMEYLQDSNEKLNEDEPLDEQEHSEITDLTAEQLLEKMKESNLLS